MSVETQRAADIAADSETIRWSVPETGDAPCAELTGRCRKYLDQIRRNPGPLTDPMAVEEEFLAQFEKFKILYVAQKSEAEWKQKQTFD